MTTRPDTQWPRYYVFEKPRKTSTLIHIGSVHGSDAEIALLNARDVFARRPDRTAMWVVRSDKIASFTREQLASASTAAEAAPNPETYFIFAKQNTRGTSVYVGSVVADQIPAALLAAQNTFELDAAWVIWVIREQDLIMPDNDDQDLLFNSASDQVFRHENHYPVRTMMRAVMRQAQKD
jgi:ring-1,2-phenylacetyl-CoA epoxidase subunit PaaB